MYNFTCSISNVPVHAKYSCSCELNHSKHNMFNTLSLSGYILLYPYDILIKTYRAIFARFNAGYILKFSSVAFGAVCSSGTTNHFITGGAQRAQFGIGWVGVGIAGTICGPVHAACRYKLIASGGSAIFVDV